MPILLSRTKPRKRWLGPSPRGFLFTRRGAFAERRGSCPLSLTGRDKGSVLCPAGQRPRRKKLWLFLTIRSAKPFGGLAAGANAHANRIGTTGRTGAVMRL